MLIAELAHRLPIILGGALIILKITVVIGLCDQAGNIAAAFVISLLERIKIKFGLTAEERNYVLPPSSFEIARENYE